MIIGFHYHIPAYCKRSGEIYVPGYLGLFLDGLARECDRLVLFMHRSTEKDLPSMDYRLRAGNIQLVSLHSKAHMLSRPVLSAYYLLPVASELEKLDLMLLRGPSPLLPAFAKKLKEKNIPYTYYLVGNYLEGLEAITKMSPFKRFILRNFYQYLDRTQERYRPDSILVNSEKLYDQYLETGKKVVLIKTTTLRDADFRSVEPDPIGIPVRLLYTGRIESPKGIADILAAMSIAENKTGKSFVLDLVGWETEKNFLQEIFRQAEECKMEGSIVFHGKKRVGSELLAMYDQADLYIIASRNNEGFPRTLWEAMARLLPIVATRVGGIPLMLRDEEHALLTEPNDPEMLADKIIELVENRELRSRLIRNAFSLARENTIEKQSKLLGDFLKNLVGH